MNIVFDIGGTKMRVARARGREVGDIQKVPTPRDPQEGLAMLIKLIRAEAGSEKIAAIAGCIAGSVNEEGVISDARNLPTWEGMNLMRELSQEFHAPVRVVNDAGAAGLGEAVVGGGVGGSTVVYVTVSTGVGGARIVDGRIDAAGGIGHTRVGDSDLEDSVSGTAVRKKFGIEPKDLSSIEVRNKLADILAEGLVLIAKQWTPDTIVLGGSMIVGVNPIPLERTAEALAKLLPGDPVQPAVKMAQLRDDGGLHGAAIIAEGVVHGRPGEIR